MNEIVAKILAERQRQFELPGTEGDFIKTPNDWIATMCSIIGEGAGRSGLPPSRQDFERAIIKTVAVGIAALEHLDHMSQRNNLT